MSSPESGDELLPQGVPGFDDPAYDDLRGLLAEARVVDPMPEDVAARIEAALADLIDPGELAKRRRSRVGPRLLIAAALVTVVGAGGVGLAQVLRHHSHSNDMAASESTVATGTTGTTGSAGKRPSPKPQAPEAFSSNSSALGLAVARLRTSEFVAGVTQLLDAHAKQLDSTMAGGAAQPSPTSPSNTVRDSLGTTICTPPATPGATTYPILLDGHQATLVVHPSSDGKRLVEAWSCDAKRVLVSVELPG